MAALEDLGFLEKTHTSSGRIPSERGYRLYVEEIIMKKKNDESDFDSDTLLSFSYDLICKLAENNNLCYYVEYDENLPEHKVLRVFFYL